MRCASPTPSVSAREYLHCEGAAQRSRQRQRGVGDDARPLAGHTKRCRPVRQSPPTHSARTRRNKVPMGRYAKALEFCLAHVVGSEAAQAYARGDMLEKRKQIMNAWAAYVSATPAKVVHLHRLTLLVGP